MSTEALSVLYLRFEFGFWFGGSIFSVNIFYKNKSNFLGKKSGRRKRESELENMRINYTANSLSCEIQVPKEKVPLIHRYLLRVSSPIN